MTTHLSQTIDITTHMAKYDASVKEVLADKQILARILKYTLEEFADYEIEAIIREMDEPQVSKIRMEPGQTNLNKIEKTSEEDNVLGEGKIYYDIRFCVYHGSDQIKILINVDYSDLWIIPIISCFVRRSLYFSLKNRNYSCT